MMDRQWMASPSLFAVTPPLFAISSRRAPIGLSLPSFSSFSDFWFKVVLSFSFFRKIYTSTIKICPNFFFLHIYKADSL